MSMIEDINKKKTKNYSLVTKILLGSVNPRKVDLKMYKMVASFRTYITKK